MTLPEDIKTVSQVELVDIDKLHMWDNNPRHNDHAVGTIAKSIAAYGMNVPLIINGSNQVIAGNTRLKACKELGLTAVPCVRAEHLTHMQQKAFNVADNKLSELASWDDPLLRDVIEEQKHILGDAWDASLMGFSDNDIDLLLNGWGADGSAADVEPDDGTAPGRIVINCPQELVGEVKQSLERFFEQEGLHGVTYK